LENDERISRLLVEATPITILWSAAGNTISFWPSFPAEAAQIRAVLFAYASADVNSGEFVVKSKLMLMTLAPFWTA